MKKSLIALTSLVALTTGSLTNIINSQKNNDTVSFNQVYGDYWDWFASHDKIAYDLTNDENQTQTFDLTDMLVLFNEAHKIYLTEDINLGALLNYSFIGDGIIVGKGVPDDLVATLEAMLGSEEIDFNNVSLLVSKNQLQVVIAYSDNGVAKEMELFSYTDSNLPLKQDSLQTVLFFYYNNH